MLHNLNLKNILFIDIETVPQYETYTDMPSPIAALWQKKCSVLRLEENESHITAYRRAGIYAEFGKIICISCGCFSYDNNFRIKSFYGDDEKELLKDFSYMMDRSFSTPDKILCAHNGKEFDFPFLCRRFLINQLPLPELLNIAGKKPWEIAHLDTMELWKFGDYKSYTSLNLLAAVFNIPTPKDDIDGSMVGKIYWEDQNLERIVTYCQKDVLTVAQIFRKYRCEELIEEESLVFS
jgi:DNA polymerase elongation subunit (family B)